MSCNIINEGNLLTTMNEERIYVDNHNISLQRRRGDLCARESYREISLEVLEWILEMLILEIQFIGVKASNLFQFKAF